MCFEADSTPCGINKPNIWCGNYDCALFTNGLCGIIGADWTRLIGLGLNTDVTHWSTHFESRSHSETSDSISHGY